ncbi:MAG: branched-chain amino acid transport system II carrier protein [Mogibacterium sp.]|nr:branched-chain amino acid transport system II carrier protein [Mogibacterium sp.]
MRRNLGVRELLVMGGGLFSMHFGAACMLFPVQWGKDAGTSLWPVFIGILMSGVILPYFGYLALVKGNGTFLSILRKLSPVLGTWFAALTIFVIGPLYMVPRMSAAAWAAIVQISGIGTESLLPVVVFSAAFYAVTYWFVASPGKVIDRVGKILFPVLIIVVAAVIIKSIACPIADRWAPPSFSQNPVVYGFLQGYATADLQCALLFGIIVVQGIRNAGIEEKNVNSNLVKIGIIGLGLLMITILGHMIAGANTGGTIDLTLSALYTQMVIELWGSAGGILFNIALITAALTTAVGAVSSTSEIWEEILHGRNERLFTYRNFCIASCVMSCVVSFADLDTIVGVVGPVLDACYPPAIVIAMYYCFSRRPDEEHNLTAGKWATVCAFAVSILQLAVRYSEMFSLGWDHISRIYYALPLAEYSLAWLPASILVFAAVALLRRRFDTVRV